jgi:GntR family transcriptional regulator
MASLAASPSAASSASDGLAAFTPIAPDAAGAPLYRVVKRSLLRAIEAGRYPAGGSLPSETELAAALGVSIGTLRHAVDELVAEHILVRRQGRGTYVALHNTDRFLFQFFHVERSDGLREAPRVELVAFERTRLDADAAQALGMKPGEPAIQIDNRLLLQGRAVIHDRLVLPSLLFKGLTEKRFCDRPSTIYHLYQTEFGITVVRAQERARAVAADRTAARILGLPQGMPVMSVHRTALTFGDKPVEYRTSTINTTQHDYVNLLSRPS